MALVVGLPLGGALQRAIDPAGASWGNTEELLAGLLEVTDYGNRMYFARNAKAGTPLPRPIRIVRPGEEPPPEDEPAQAPAQRPQATPDEIRRFAGSQLKVVPKES